MTGMDFPRFPEPERDERVELGGVEPAGMIVTADHELAAASHADPVARSQWWLFRRRFFRHKGAIISIVVLILLTIACFGADWIAPFDPNRQDILLGDVSPNGTHWLGTDILGKNFRRVSPPSLIKSWSLGAMSTTGNSPMISAALSMGFLSI